jgi:putative salt-induced outer membrane protein YdiY
MTDASDLSVSAAIQYDTERFYEATPDKEKIRLSIRPRVLQSLGKNMEFAAVLFYQPNVKEFDDYMLIFNTSLEAKLLEKLSLKLTYSYDYESMPALETIKKTDTSFITSLVLNF